MSNIGEANMTVRRSKIKILAFLGGYGLILILYFLHLLGVIFILGVSSWVAGGFIFCFILPAFAYFCFLWSKRHVSILTISDLELELRSGLFLHRTLTLPKSSIEKVATNWEGEGSESPMDLIFVLRDDASAIARTSPVLKFRKDGWHFDLSTADLSPRHLQMLKELVEQHLEQ